MRFKVKTHSREDFQTIKTLVSRAAPIYVEPEKRLMLSTGDLSKQLRTQIEASGATVVEDQRYELDTEEL